MINHNIITLTLTAAAGIGLIAVIPTRAEAQETTMPACQVENPPPNCGQGNMWAVQVDQVVPNGAYVHVTDPGCMNDVSGALASTLSAALTAADPRLALFSGPLGKLLEVPVGTYLRNQGGDIGRYFSPYAKNGALCAPVIAVVPVGARVVGFRFLAADARDGWMDDARVSPWRRVRGRVE